MLAFSLQAFLLDLPSIARGGEEGAEFLCERESSMGSSKFTTRYTGASMAAHDESRRRRARASCMAPQRLKPASGSVAIRPPLSCLV